MKLADRINLIAESATLAVTAKAAQLKRDGVDVISFAAGEPDFDTPAAIKRIGIEAIEAGRTGYSKPASGLPSAKEAVCARFLRDNALHYTPDQVLITAGGKMAFYLALQALVDPGDEVLLARPYWVSYPEITKLAGGVPVFVVGPPQRDYKLRPEDVEPAITKRTRVFVINSPSNPSGATYTPDEIRQLAELLQDRNVWVVSDEIYDRLVYDGNETLSYAAVSDKTYARTVTINSASKTYAMTGWRLGFVGGPTEVIRAMAKLQSQMTSGAVTFNQIALAAALNEEHDELATMHRAFEQRGRRMHEALNALSGVHCNKPAGAFYCFPNVAGTYGRLAVNGSVEFAQRLLDEIAVAVVPGAAFGMDEHVRLSFAVGMDRIEEGLRRLTRMLG